MDECVRFDLVVWLDELQHDVASIQESTPGLPDPEVLQRSVDENRILITQDKDFGNLVFKQGQPHVGIVLLRLRDATSDGNVAAMLELLELHHHQLAGNFTVTTGRRVRVI